jgi:hypothetical protein
MVDLTKEEWYLKYTEDIQEKDFDKLILYLNNIGLKQFSHAGCGLNFIDFKRNKFLRSDINYVNYNSFCIDNNRQVGIGGKEIYFKDLFNLINKNQEVYIEIW